MNKIAIFPGSFDPITNGHVDIIKRTLPLFDKIIVAIGVNTQKKYLFSLEDRKAWIKEVFKDEPKVEIDSYNGLTINYCKKAQASYIIRGIRSALDFEYEKTIAHLNSTMQPDIETVLILSKAELSSISSTIVREIIIGNGDIGKFIPHSISDSITKDKIHRQ
ncbi:MAG: pantetheine-phosphate adenylyltransferase [Chitinophagales bacterium]|nr:pantetheine-phosphate adenylyltransferase [Chitinophagales bacterium]